MHPIAELHKLLALAGVADDVIWEALELAQRHAAEAKCPLLRTLTDTWHDSCILSFLSTSTSLLEEEKKEREKERESREKERERENKRCGSRIPPDWKPTDRHYREGSKLGYQREQVDGFAETMRLWAEANAHRPVARKLDWDKTFSGWMRRQPKIPPPPSAPPAKLTAEDIDRKGGWRPGLPTDAELRQIWGPKTAVSKWVRGTDGGENGEI